MLTSELGTDLSMGLRQILREDSDVIYENKEIMMKNRFWWEGI